MGEGYTRPVLDPITIQVAGIREIVDGVQEARKRCLALSKEYPSHWVAANRDTHDPERRVVHLLEPSALAGVESEDDAPAGPLPDQEAMF